MKATVGIDDGGMVRFEGGRGGGLDGGHPSGVDRFSIPEPLTALNTSATVADPSLSPDGQELFFISTRNGAAHEIWRSIRACP